MSLQGAEEKESLEDCRNLFDIDMGIDVTGR